jgi:hypothetical protein
MVFTNPIMTTHVHKTTYWPLISSIIAGRYKSTDVEDPKGGHWEPSIITQGIFDRKNGHFVKPSKVALKYLNFKKEIDQNVHVKVFNYVVNANA